MSNPMSNPLPGPLGADPYLPPGSGDAEWHIVQCGSGNADVVAIVDPNLTIDSLGYSAGDTALLFSAAYDAFGSSASRLGVDAVEFATSMREDGIAEMAEALKAMWDDFGGAGNSPSTIRARQILSRLGLLPQGS